MYITKILILITLFVQTSVLTNVYAGQSNIEILNRIWDLAAKKACSKEMANSFNAETKLKLISQLKSSNNIDDLAEVLNPFLFSFGFSHTEFLTPSTESYYLFKSLTVFDNPKLPAAPKIINPGVQLRKDKDNYFVREVLSGFPAQLAGFQRDDQIISINGEMFKGSWGNTVTEALIKIRRSNEDLLIPVKIQALNWTQAFQDATENSFRIITRKDGKKIGYIHLWTGTHPKSAPLLQKLVNKLKKSKIDGLVLDLRGGYGGAWWEHLDPFYANTKDYIEMEIKTSDGETEILKSPFKKNKHFYTGPMVVLINEGVRSGKEAMAYQFKKTKRAYLVGTKTPGYFSTGQYFFSNEPLNYVLYLCVYQLKLDGDIIEKIGVEPDLNVPFENSGEFKDSQLNYAIDYLSMK